MKGKRLISVLLSIAMTLSVIPIHMISVSAALIADKPDVDVSDSGQYADAALGKGASQALFVNGAFGTGEISIDDPGGKIIGGDKTGNVDDYNMMNCFGIYRNGSAISQTTPGFSTKGGQSINFGSAYAGGYALNMCTYNDKAGKSGSMTVRIADNPTLKALAKTGGLQMYYHGYACAAKEARTAWPDDQTYVWGWIKVDGVTKGSSGKASAESKGFGTNGFITLDENSVITIEWKVDRGSEHFSNGWADKDVGIGGSVLLFRKSECPNLANYTLTSNGNLSYNENGIPEVLLGKNGKIELDLNITLGNDSSKPDAVESSLMGKNIKNSDDYNLLEQLGKRVLFKNTEGTGYYREGEPVYMKLTKVDGANISDSDAARIKSLQGSLSSMHFEWNANYGDYYGNNPIPNEGDWAGLVSGSNALNLIDSVVLASFHDPAGNPLKIGGRLVTYSKAGSNYNTNLQYEQADNYVNGKTYQYNKETDYYTLVESKPTNWDTSDKTHYFVKRDVLKGTVRLNNSEQSGLGNPFAVNNTANSGYNFIIDAVSPTYSKTSNAVQPDILSDLTLNKGDSFDIILNFSEVVKLRQFYDDGSYTGFDAKKLYLEFNNGLKAQYKDGIGTKRLVFNVSVPDMYTLTLTQPETWYATYSSYYTKNGDGSYTKISSGSAPVWKENTYYSYVADVTGEQYLEIRRMYVEDTKGHQEVILSAVGGTNENPTAESYVLTDYVGNPMVEYIGKKTNSYNTTMAWAKLQIDNTTPQLNLKREYDGSYTVNVIEAGSGVFHINNATSDGDSNSAGIIYYVWVDGEENAVAVKDAFCANNFEKVKSYSLSPSDNDKVTVNGKTYQLNAASADSNLAHETESGDWYLVVFTADMTWDSARQLIQYGNSSYKTDPSGYLTLLAKNLGVSIGDMFVKVDTAPADWDTSYMNYYYKTGNTYSKIPQGDKFPEWKANTYYARAYTKLDSEPDGWNPYRESVGGNYKKLKDGTYVLATENGSYEYDDTNDYTHYFTLNKDGSFSPIKLVTGVPTFESGKYFAKYAKTSAGLTSANAASVYVRDTDDEGNPTYVSALVKYAPVFPEGAIYDSAKKLVNTEPDDWNTTYMNYYYRTNSEFDSFAKWVTSAAPTFPVGGVYDENKDFVGSKPDDWDSNYTNYFEKNGDEYTQIVPKFTEGNFYEVTYEALESMTDGDDNIMIKAYDEFGVEQDSYSLWEDTYSNYYTMSGGNYIKVTGQTAPNYTDGVYYRATYTLQTSIPDDWDINYDAYVTLKEYEYIPVDASFPDAEDNVKYYVFKDNPSALTEIPDDWNSEFIYYSTKAEEYSPVQRESCPEFKTGTYYTYGYKLRDEKPENWEESYSQFCYKSGDDYYKATIETETQRETLKSVGIEIKSAVPDFAYYNTGVYEANGEGFVNVMAQKIEDPVRKAAFIDDMLSAYNDALKVQVARRYFEFASEVHKADVELLESAANYAQWPRLNYVQNDSNQAWTISDYVDKNAPDIICAVQDGTDNTEDVKVDTTVKDSSEIAEIKYQFAPAETVITVDTVDGWTMVEDVDGSEKNFAVSSKDSSVTSGIYDLYIYAKDKSGNAGIKKITVNVNSTVAINNVITGPEGSAPYNEFTGAKIQFYGTAYGTDIFERDFKVYATIDDNAVKDANDADWGEVIAATPADSIDGFTAMSYTLPEKTGVTGYYYLHILYTYKDSADNLCKGQLNKAYALNGASAKLTINQTGVTNTGIKVEISAAGAGSVKYAITKADVTDQPTEWYAYENILELDAENYSDYNGAIRVWAMLNDDDSTVCFGVFNLNGSSQASGEVAKPDVKLIDIIENDGSKYAIIYFDNLGDALSVGAEYSVSISNKGTALKDCVWQRWMPLDNTIKVKLGDLNTPKQLMFKFKNGKNISTESNYRTIEITNKSVGTGEDWTIAERSTLRQVGSAVGMTMTYKDKNGTSSSETVNVNGVYTKDTLKSVVNNINNNPPTYNLTWSDGNKHLLSDNVAVTVSSEENISVTGLTFTPDGGLQENLTPSKTYRFKKNGTAVFTIQNEAGNTADVIAKVTWIDDTPLEIGVVADYTGYNTYGSGDNIISNGAKLILTSNKLLMMAEIGGKDVSQTLSCDISHNGTYDIVAIDNYGKLITKKVSVNNIVRSVSVPAKISSVLNNGGESVTVTFKGLADNNNPLYDGKKVGGTQLTGNYAITKTYTRNGVYTNYITDSLGNTKSYSVTIAELDDTAPTISANDTVISMNKTNSPESQASVAAWIKSNLDITDDKTANDDIEVTLSGNAVNTAVPGAYTVIVSAKDKAGNRSSLRQTVYILPTDGMLITDEHGVMFCSSSKDAALVNRNKDKKVKLTIGRYDLIDLVGADTPVFNKDAKITVTVKQGAYREGQMKYFDSVSKQIKYNNRKAEVMFDVDDLPGTGWYTVIIRNSEREREFTTFFINADN